ncbi:cupin domain-containing protein [Aciditerrimonas ferrireducens]|uniref:Cupin domain-containing protein n=1 Tax=Aciditerrimonas ferrireducens TaxID=667306 RepID=A0ABV6C4G1_9ACTN
MTTLLPATGRASGPANAGPAEAGPASLDPTVPVGPLDLSAFGFEGRLADLTAKARFFEYTAAADPIGAGLTPAVPVVRFSRSLYAEGPTRVVPLDLAEHLGTPWPATSPGLLASFVRVESGDELALHAEATSQLVYVLEGRGLAVTGGRLVALEKGDFVTLPAGWQLVHYAEEPTSFYWVHDAPLLRYLGATPTVARFEPTHYRRADAVAALAAAAADPAAATRNRLSVLLANATMEQTRTITHVLWAMFGLLPPGAVQPPHRHQSVALDLILDCQPGCATLLGDELDEQGRIVDPIRVEWEPGCAFVTPPGRWHAHVNESGAPAHLIPVQDAGLQTYLRSLDIRFASGSAA